jgi:hypothetical protein
LLIQNRIGRKRNNETALSTIFKGAVLAFFEHNNIIGIGLLIILNVQYQTGIESLFGGKTSRRIQELSQIIGKDLNSRSQSEWDNILKNYSQIYEVQFFVFRCNGTQLQATKSFCLRILCQNSLLCECKD